MSILCTIPLLSLLFNVCEAPQPLATGYVEGDYVQIAPIEVTQIAAIPVKRGDHVTFDQPLAILERRDAEIAVAETQAALAKANSQLADLTIGARPEKIATLEATLAAAAANAREAKRDLDRQAQLLKKGTTSQSAYDQAQTSLDVSEAKVEELKANLAYTKLPGRKDQIEAARAASKQAEAALEKARWHLKKRTLKSSQPGIIVDIIRDLGEVAGPQAPIISMLPDGGVKLRLYIAETALNDVKVGSLLDVECDGCAKGITAKVSYIADGPEFTPPVIYSLENRQKLVYLIEARPQDKAEGNNMLKPGQIVSVKLHDKANGAEQ